MVYHDFIICIEATSNVAPVADELKKFLKSFCNKFQDIVEEKDIDEKQARVKFIVFRDFSCCENAIIQSRFFDILEKDIEQFIDDIEFKGGYGYCNAFEAIALGLQSEWMISSEDKIIRDIWLFSNGKVRPLGGNQKLLPKYPPNMPESFEQLSSRWHTVGPYNRTPVCMIGYVPKTEPWITLQTWNGYWPAYTDCCGMDFDEMNHMTIMDMLIDTDYR